MDLLKLKTAGESGQEGKEDMTVIQEMITTLQVIWSKSHFIIIPLILLFSVCESGRPGYGEEGVYDPVDPNGQVLLAGITELHRGFQDFQLHPSFCRSGTTGGLTEHFRTVLRVLLENLEDPEGR